jgi:hypothetical protein
MPLAGPAYPAIFLVINGCKASLRRRAVRLSTFRPIAILPTNSSFAELPKGLSWLTGNEYSLRLQAAWTGAASNQAGSIMQVGKSLWPAHPDRIKTGKLSIHVISIRNFRRFSSRL